MVEHFEATLGPVRAACTGGVLLKVPFDSTEEDSVDSVKNRPAEDLATTTADIVTAMDETEMVHGWTDRFLLGMDDFSLTKSDAGVLGYDNIVEVRTMLEHAPEATAFTTAGDVLVEKARELGVARSAQTLNNGVFARLLTKETWGGKSGYMLDGFTQDRRAWTMTPSWWLAQELCSRGENKTASLFSVMSIRWILQSPPTMSALCGLEPQGEISIVANVLRNFNSRQKQKPVNEPYIHWRISHLASVVTEVSSTVQVTRIVELIKLEADDNTFHEAVRGMTIERLVTQGGYVTPYTNSIPHDTRS
jgi:hypothetical protein